MHLQKIQNNNPKLPQLVSQALIDAIESGQIQVGQELVTTNGDLKMQVGQLYKTVIIKHTIMMSKNKLYIIDV